MREKERERERGGRRCILVTLAIVCRLLALTLLAIITALPCPGWHLLCVCMCAWGLQGSYGVDFKARVAAGGERLEYAEKEVKALRDIQNDAFKKR